jgi:hypothetical protein
MDKGVPVHRRYFYALKHFRQLIKRGLPKGNAAPATGQAVPPAGARTGDLNLQPGEWVEVRSLEEIHAMLDDRQRTGGLLFMTNMAQDCGKRFRVYKKVERIRLETTSQMRKIRSPTVFLEGSICNRCDRACYNFWREAWLKRVET